MKVLTNECMWCGGKANLKIEQHWFCNDQCLTDALMTVNSKDIQKTRLQIYTELARLEGMMTEAEREDFKSKVSPALKEL